MASLLLPAPYSKPDGMVTEFDGLQLHLSRNSPTGFLHGNDGQLSVFL